MKYAQLGTMEFELMESFDSTIIESEYNYVEHVSLSGKSHLQYLGSTQAILQIGIRFHSEFCTPELRLNELYLNAREAKILPLIYMSGLYKGRFVIVAIREEIIKSDSMGKPLCIDVLLTLKGVETTKGYQFGNI